MCFGNQNQNVYLLRKHITYMLREMTKNYKKSFVVINQETKVVYIKRKTHTKPKTI